MSMYSNSTPQQAQQPSIGASPVAMRGAPQNLTVRGNAPSHVVASSPLPQPIAMSPQQLLQVAQTRLGRQLTREESRMVLIEGLGAVKLPPAPPVAGAPVVESPHVSAAGDLAPPPPIANDARPSPFRRQPPPTMAQSARRAPVATPVVANGLALPPPIAAAQSARVARPSPAVADTGAADDAVMRERGRTLSPGPRRPVATPDDDAAAVMRDRGRTLSPGPRRPAAAAPESDAVGDAARDRARTLSPGRPMPPTPAAAAATPAAAPFAPMTATAAAPKLLPATPMAPMRRMPPLPVSGAVTPSVQDDMATPSRSTPLSPRVRARGQTEAPPPRVLPTPTPPVAVASPVSPLSPRAAARRQPDIPAMRGPPLEPIAAEAVPPAGGALLSPRLPPRRQPDAPVSPRGDAEPTPLSPRAPSRAPSAMRRPMPDASASDVAGTPLSPRTLPRRPPPALDAPAAAAVPMRTPARVGGAAAVRAPPPVAQAPVVEQAPIAAMPLSPRTPMRMPARLANGPARPARTPIASSPPVPADLTPPRVGSMKAPPIPQSDPTPPPIPASDGSLRRGAVQAGGQYGLTSMAKPVHTPSNEYVAVAPLADDRPLPLVQQESSYGQVPPQPQSNYGLTPKKPSAPGALQTPAGFTPVLSAVPLPRKVAMNAISRGSGGSGGSGTPPPGEYVLQPIAARSESEYSLGDDDASPPSTPPPPSQNEYVQVDPLPRESHRNEYAKVEPLGPPSEYVKVDFSDKNSNSSQDVVPPAQPESPMAPAVPTLSASATPPAGSLGSPNGIVSSSSSAPMLAKGAFYGTVGISSVSHASLISNTGLMKDARVPMTLTARQSRYAPFLQILSGSSLLLINALCVAAGGADEEPLLTAICCGLDAHGMLRDAVTSGIAAEVAGSADATTLFRANNGTTKLVGAFTKLVGQQYLISLIKPYIAELSTSKDTCEVDATKLNKEDYEADFVEADVVADNVEQLKHWTTRLLQKLTASLAECPPALKWLSAALRVGVTHRFPSSGTVSVAGFYFLRYVCPALVAPVARGVTTQKPLPRVVNALKYISKMVQAMANGVVFKKEASMLPLNDYVREHSAQVNEICNALAGDTSPTMPPLASVGDAESIHLRYVYLFMVQNRDKVEKSLVSYKQDEVLGMIPDVIDAIGMSQNAQLTPLKEKLQVDEVLSRKESVADATGADAGAAGGASKARGRKLERRTGRGALAMMSGAVKCEVCGERPFESRVTRADGKAVLACNACEASGAAVAMN